MASAGSDGSWPEEDDGANNEGEDRASAPSARAPPISCETCKSRKVRCDRKRPACGWCSKNGHHCTYKARKKPGLRAGFGKELESRLERLENVIDSQQDLLSHLAGRMGGEQRTSSAMNLDDQYSIGDATSALPPLAQTPNSQSAVSHSVNDVSTLPAHSTTTLPWTGMTGLQNHPHEMTEESIFHQNGLPPYDLLCTLTKFYFVYVYPDFPLLHEPTMNQLLSSSATLKQEDFILIHAIVVITLRYCNDARLDGGTREQYHRHSKHKVILHATEVTTLKSLQALVIVALDVVGSSNGPPALNLLAMASRSVVQLGLATETTPASLNPKPPSISTLQADILSASECFVEEESRRRLFWMFYVLDRLATVATAFDFTLEDSNIHRRLPCHHDFFICNHAVLTEWFDVGSAQTESSGAAYLGPFGHFVKIVGILSKIHLFLRKPINIGSNSDVAQWQREYRELDVLLRAWHSNLPHKYQSVLQPSSGGGVQQIDRQTVLLHMTLHMTTIRLHSSAAYPTNQSQLFVPSSSASQRCLEAVQHIVTLCDLIKTSEIVDQLGPPVAFCVWVAARLLLVHGATIERQVEPSIISLVETLELLGRNWNVAARYAALLRRVLDEFHQSSSPDVAEHHNRTSAPSVQILADMRRCAYDLDLLISRQPRLQSSPSPIKAAMLSGTAETSLEYLDLFDFFNVPRLPVAEESMNLSLGPPGSTFPFHGSQDLGGGAYQQANFLFDPNADWLSDPSVMA